MVFYILTCLLTWGVGIKFMVSGNVAAGIITFFTGGFFLLAAIIRYNRTGKVDLYDTLDEWKRQ